MAKGIFVKVKGLKTTANRLGKLEEKISRRVMAGVETLVNRMEREAISKAPSAGDSLDTKGKPVKSPYNVAGAVRKELDAESLSGKVSVEGTMELKYWASYTNFGTGSDAASYLGPLSGEWKTMAAQFIKDGKGRILHTGWFTQPALKMEDQAVSVIEKKVRTVKL